MSQILFFLNEGGTLTTKNLVIKVKKIQDDNKVNLEITAPWHYDDELTHHEVVAEGTTLQLEKEDQIALITPHSVIKNGMFSCVNLDISMDKGDAMLLEPDQQAYIKSYSPVDVLAGAMDGDSVTFYKPSGMAIPHDIESEAPETSNIPLTADQLDEEGVWSVVLDSPTRNATTVKWFYVEDVPIQHTHALDLVFQPLDYQSIDDLYQLALENLPELQGDILGAMANIPDQDFCFVGVDRTDEQIIVRLNVALKSSVWDARSLAGLISTTVLARANVGAPAGYVLYDANEGVVESTPYTVSDLLAINKALVKTQLDRDDDVVSVLTIDKKRKAAMFPLASVAALDEAIVTVGDNLTTDPRAAAISAVRRLEDNVTSVYDLAESVYSLPVAPTTLPVLARLSGPVADFYGSHRNAVIGAVVLAVLVIILKLYQRRGGKS